jgi:hypothetical protein
LVAQFSVLRYNTFLTGADMLADTKLVRKMVNSIVGVSAKYTDKGANNTRLLAWDIGSTNANKIEKEVKDLFALAGFTNKVKVTTSDFTFGTYSSSGGNTFLRINASYKD